MNLRKKTGLGIAALLIGFIVLVALLSIVSPRFAREESLSVEVDQKAFNEGFAARSQTAGAPGGDMPYPAAAPAQAGAGGAIDSMADKEMAAKQAAPMEANVSSVAGGASPVPVTRLKPQLIRRASLAITVEKLPVALNKVKALVTLTGGYITNQQISFLDAAQQVRAGSLEIRLPANQFDAFLDGIQGVGKTPGPQISTEDVGKQISDLGAQIHNKQQEEAQLQQIMKRSGKIPEILEVSRELARVRGEIEAAQGSLKYYQEQVAYSTVTVSLSEENVGSPVKDKPGFDVVLGNAFSGAFDKLVNFVTGLITGLVHILVFLIPVLLILGVLALLVFKVLAKLVSPLWTRLMGSKPQASTKDESNP